MFSNRFALMQMMILIATCLFSACHGQSGNATKALIKKLFETNEYDPIVRPMADHMTPMQVDLDFVLVGINGLNEVEGKLTTTGYLPMFWRDEFLTWDDPMDVMQIYVPQDMIWKPDITLKNGFKKLSELGSDFVLVKILSTGHVWWQPLEVFDSKCDISITYFPFDQQTCDLVFVVWSYEIFDVNVTLGSNGIGLEEVEDGGEWKIVSTSAKEDKEGMESKVTFTLTIERNAEYYIFNIIIPVIFLGLLNVFTYVIPADSGEKMGYAMTVFLSFAVFLTIVSSELPRSTGSYLGYYMMELFGFGVLTVALTSVQLRLHHRESPVPRCLASLIKCKCCCKNNRVDDEEGQQKKKEESQDPPEPTWADVTATIDFVMFWVLLILFAVSTVALMAILKNRLTLL